MRKVLRWLGTSAGVLVLLAIVMYGLARLRAPSEDQAAALAVLEDMKPPPGRNAFGLLWLLPYDVPDAEREQVLAGDVRRFEKMSVAADAEGYADFESIAAKRYPTEEKAERERYCKWRDRDCLAKVRAEPAAYARLLEGDAALLARADTMSQYGHVRSPFPARPDTPFPTSTQLSFPLTQHAYSFVSGNVEAGLDGVCRGVSASRMLIRDGGSLINSMIGAIMLQGNAALLADMLAELPVERPLPDSCTTAFAPATAEEFGLCQTVRGEARFMFGVARQTGLAPYMAEHFPQWLLPVVYNPDKTIARMAPGLAWHCGEQARSMLEADLPAQGPPGPSMSTQPFKCIDNLVGCILVDVDSPGFDKYQRRLQDAAIRLKMAATILWLRDRPAEQPATEALEQRPAALRSPHREFQLGKDGDSISIELFDSSHGKSWSLPLPGSRPH